MGDLECLEKTLRALRDDKLHGDVDMRDVEVLAGEGATLTRFDSGDAFATLRLLRRWPVMLSLLLDRELRDCRDDMEMEESSVFDSFICIPLMELATLSTVGLLCVGGCCWWWF